VQILDSDEELHPYIVILLAHPRPPLFLAGHHRFSVASEARGTSGA
jgi:hypothetical protein